MLGFLEEIVRDFLKSGGAVPMQTRILGLNPLLVLLVVLQIYDSNRLAALEYVPCRALTQPVLGLCVAWWPSLLLRLEPVDFRFLIAVFEKQGRLHAGKDLVDAVQNRLVCGNVRIVQIRLVQDLRYAINQRESHAVGEAGVERRKNRRHLVQ